MDKPERADLYDLEGNKLPQKWVWYLPDGGAVLGMTKRECELNYLAACEPTGPLN